MRRAPFFWAALALTAGIGAAPLFFPWRLPLAVTAVAGGVGLAAWYWWRRDLPFAVALGAVFLLGTLLPAPPVPSPTAARVTVVRGWLDGETKPRAAGAYLGARVVSWRLGNGPWLRPARGFHLWLGGVDGTADYGRWFEARGRLLAGGSAGYDGYFHAKTHRFLARRSGSILRRAGLALRAAMDRAYRRYLGPTERGLLAGLIFGDLPALPAETLACFRDTGGLHLLSVSGLHVGFVLALVLTLAGAFGWRGWRAWALAAPVLLIYVTICGPKPPVLRATVMALAVGVGSIGHRKIGGGNLLGLAAVAVLLLEPWALRTVSFQLSFAACAGLVFLYPRWADWCPPRLAFIGKPFLISLAASLAVLPIQVAAFGRLSPIGPVANLVLVPLAGLIVQVGLAAGLVGTVLSWLAAPLLAGLGLIIDLLLVLARLGAHLPGAAVNTGAWPWPLCLGFYIVLGMVGFGMEKNVLNRRPKLAWGGLALMVTAAVAVFVWWQVLAAPGGLVVSFVDVGQGDCIFIRAPGGQTALVDGGEPEAAPRVLSYLRRQGVNRLDLLILSHPHSDHVGGLSAVVAEIPVGRVLDPGWPHPSEVYQDFLLKLKERRIPWRRARRGLSFALGRGVTGTVLHPPPVHPVPDDLNEGSLVIRLRFGGQTLLLPGDLGVRGEEELVTARDELRADLLKVAHHGSATGTSAPWLDAVRPRIAVISVGRFNSFHHPSGGTLARLCTAGARIYRTDERGTIRYWTDGRRYRIECAR